MTQCPTGDHEPNERGHLLLHQPRPLNTAAGRGPLRVGRKERNSRINTILARAANRKDIGLHRGRSGARALSAFVPREILRAWTLPAGGALGRVPRAGTGQRCCGVRAPPPPPLHVTPLGQSAQAITTHGPGGTQPGARDKPEARRVAARGSAAAAAPRAHGDRAGSLGNWGWPGRVPLLSALSPGRRNSQVRRPSLPE